MRKIALAVPFLLLAVAAIRAEDAPATPPPLDTLEKKVAYGLGYQLGSQLKTQGATIDGDALLRGLRDGLDGTAPVMSADAMDAAMAAFQKQLQANAVKIRAEQAAKNKREGAAFLEKNKTAEGVQTTASGLQYKVVKAGTGQKPVGTDTVVVNYEGTFLDGTVFDSSYKRGKPETFGVTQVIPGWTEGLQLMDVGSTYLLYIPSDIAYGENPPPQFRIPPNATLVFKVELLEIHKR